MARQKIKKVDIGPIDEPDTDPQQLPDEEPDAVLLPDEMSNEDWLHACGYDKLEAFQIRLTRMAPDKARCGTSVAGHLELFRNKVPTEDEVRDKYGGGDFQIQAMLWDGDRWRPKRRRKFHIPGDPKVPQRSAPEPGAGKGSPKGGEDLTRALIHLLAQKGTSPEQVIEEIKAATQSAAAADVRTAEQRALYAEDRVEDAMRRAESAEMKWRSAEDQVRMATLQAQQQVASVESRGMETLRLIAEQNQTSGKEIMARAMAAVDEARREAAAERERLEKAHHTELDNLQTRLVSMHEREIKNIEVQLTITRERNQQLEADLRTLQQISAADLKNAQQAYQDLMLQHVTAQAEKSDVIGQLSRFAEQKDTIANLLNLVPSSEAAGDSKYEGEDFWKAWIPDTLKHINELAKNVSGKKDKGQQAQTRLHVRPQAEARVQQATREPQPAPEPQRPKVRRIVPDDLRPYLDKLSEAHTQSVDASRAVEIALSFGDREILVAIAATAPDDLIAGLQQHNLLANDLMTDDGQGYMLEFLRILKDRVEQEK